MWPFSKNKKEQDAAPAAEEPTSAVQSPVETDEPNSSAGESFTINGVTYTITESQVVDGISATVGPFDKRHPGFETRDFSQFAQGDVDLGAMIVPIPHKGEVQVEVADNGPRAVHIVTEFGRITPAAFAAPRSGGQWEDAIPTLVEQLAGDGLDVTLEAGPWGSEIKGVGPGGTVRILGVNGNSWMLRLFGVGPTEASDQFVELMRDFARHTVVNRGDGPIPAGNVLEVRLPDDMASALQEAMQQKAQESNTPQLRPPFNPVTRQNIPVALGLVTRPTARHSGPGVGAPRATSAMDELDKK